MSKSLPFTKASLRRAIEAVESTGKFVIGVRPDGTLIVGMEPVKVASILEPQQDDSPEWDDVQA